MRSRPIATAAALLLSTACATQPRRPAASSPAASAAAKPPPRPKVVCVNEAPTGSHIPERRCRRVEDVERERQATQAELMQPRASPPPKGN